MTRARRLRRWLGVAARELAALTVACAFAIGTVPQAAAHDCSGPDDCAVLPPNVNIGTGIAAVVAGASAGWFFARRRNQIITPPCDDLRKEVAAGEEPIKKLEAELAAVEAGTGSAAPAARQAHLHDLRAALARERGLQVKRVSALAKCDGTPDPGPPDVADIQRAVDAAKNRFEELQEALKAEVAKQLADIDKFNNDYDKYWTGAMRGTEQYMNDYPELMRDLEKIWEELGNREWAREVAEWVDVGIQAAMAGVQVYRAGAGVVKGMATAAEGEAAKAGAKVVGREAEAAAAAARTAEGDAAAVAERQAAERAAAEKVAAEKAAAEKAAAAERAAAEKAAAEKAAAEKAAAEKAAAEKAAAKNEPLKAEEWDPNAPEESIKPAAEEPPPPPPPPAPKRFVDANGVESKIPLLRPGPQGHITLNRLPGTYIGRQNEMYVDSINKYAQEMINGKFKWKEIPDMERIIMNAREGDINAIYAGHHRFQAARIASQVTGRPLMEGANAIIPAEGFASAEARAVATQWGTAVPKPISEIGLSPGSKPPSLKYPSLDATEQAIRDALDGK